MHSPAVAHRAYTYSKRRELRSLLCIRNAREEQTYTACWNPREDGELPEGSGQ